MVCCGVFGSVRKIYALSDAPEAKPPARKIASETCNCLPGGNDLTNGTFTFPATSIVNSSLNFDLKSMIISSPAINSTSTNPSDALRDIFLIPKASLSSFLRSIN